MTPKIVLAGAAALLAACAAQPRQVDPPLILLGGYRDPADMCRIAGETAFTSRFLDHTSDLVACPADAENLGVFVTETGAVEVGRTQGHILYSVPHLHS